jgi:hypothetical protein
MSAMTTWGGEGLQRSDSFAGTISDVDERTKVPDERFQDLAAIEIDDEDVQAGQDALARLHESAI